MIKTKYKPKWVEVSEYDNISKYLDVSLTDMIIMFGNCRVK